MGHGLTVIEVARCWGIPVTQVTRYCREGRIEGAVKEGKRRMIPEGSQKPPRKKTPPTTAGEKLSLPIGVSNYIDKTALLKELMDERPKVSLFTRPRRFGKTLTMDMVKTFFEVSKEDASVYFRDKKIWSYGGRDTLHGRGNIPSYICPSRISSATVGQKHITF